MCGSFVFICSSFKVLMMRFNGVCAYSKKGAFHIGFCEFGVSPAVDLVVNNEKSGVGARDVFCDCDAEESVVFVRFR